MLEVNNLSIKRIENDQELIKDLSFTLNQGDKVAIIGHEGNGKSTLLKAIYDRSLIPYVDIKGSIVVKGKIAYLEQEIAKRWANVLVYDYFLKPTPEDEIQLEDYERLTHLDRYLNRVKFPIEALDEDKTIHQFSGGEVVKLGIVKLLLLEPDIFLLDEPTNDLDFETILFLEDFIQTEERPILFVSHDEALLENTTNGIIHLILKHKRAFAQSFFEKMGYEEYKETRALSLEKENRIARKQRKDYKEKMERFRQIYQKVEHQQNQAVRNPSLGRLLKKKMHSIKSMGKRIEREKEEFLDIPEQEEAIELFFPDHIAIPNGKMVLDLNLDVLSIEGRELSRDIKLMVKGQTKLAIIGRNGTGKSTLLQKIYVDLKDRTDLSVGYMSQKYEELNGSLTALKFLMDEMSEDQESRIRKMFGALHFTREEMVYPTTMLSGGQKAKLILLKMVLRENNVLLLDEPTRNLSPLSAPEIHELLLEFKGCVICVTHDRKFIENVFDEVYELTKEGLHKKA